MSRSAVYWDEDWIQPTKEWSARRSIAAVRLLGHQLLADVLGGTVSDMGAYEVGYSPIEQVGDCPKSIGSLRPLPATSMK